MTDVATKCLLKKHQTRTVEDLVKRTNKLHEPQRAREHTSDQACICHECIQDRSQGCKNPHECAREAMSRLRDIAPKFNPLSIIPQDGLSLTPNRKARNVVALITNKDVIFDPSITCKGSLADCFRIFTNTEENTPNPAMRTPTRGINLANNKIEVHTDGACMNNGKADASCGSGIWFGPGHPLNNAVKVPGPNQSNQIGELVAIIKTAETAPNFYELSIVSDSRYVIEGLTKHLPEWEDKGWIGVENAEMFKRAAYLLKTRTAPTTFKWVKGHSGNLGNEESDALAKEGALKHTPDELSLHIPDDFDLQGAKLKVMTQALAYQGIMAQRNPHSRTPATQNLEQTRAAIKAYQGSLETNEAIWQSIRKRTIRLRVQQFFYKAMHNALMVGSVWKKIPGYEDRGICQICNTTESMEHILTTCGAEPIRLVWNLAKETWPHNQSHWPEISLGTILGSGCLTTPEEPPRNGRETRVKPMKKRGANRLLQILISEAAHLTWVLRCERVIQQQNHSTQEITARWWKATNRRLTDDKITATQIKRSKPFTHLVEATWGPVLRKFSDPPHMWIRNREVLVGSRVNPAWTVEGPPP